MTYKITSVMPAGEWQSLSGTMVKYTIMLEGEDTSCELNQKQSTPAPQVGDTLEGEITTDKWGRKFKKTSKGFGGKSDPATQASIERQNALTNAIAYCTNKAQILADKTKVSVDRQLSGKHVIEVAALFSAFNAGKITPDMTPEVIANLWNKEETPKEPETPPQSQPEPDVPSASKAIPDEEIANMEF